MKVSVLARFAVSRRSPRNSQAYCEKFMSTTTALAVSAQTKKNLLVRTALLVGLTIFVGTLMNALIGEKLLFLYKEELHLSAGDVGTLAILTGIPSYLQPFMGAWSELFPLFGYHRRSYFILASLLDAFGFLCLSTLHQYHYAVVAGLIILTGTGGVLLWVMTNATMVAIGNQTGSFGRLQSLRLFVPLAMQIAFTSHLGGYAAEKWSYGLVFGLAALLSLVRGTFFVFITEPSGREVASRTETAEARAAREQRKAEERAKTVQALRKAAATPGLWVIVGYVFYLILTPGLNTARVYFEKDALHFTKQFIGDLGRYQAVGFLIGVAGFGLVSRRLPIWSLVWGAWLMDTLGYLMMLQVHDARSAQIFLTANGAVGVVYDLCLMTLAARACPPGIEGTIYGLVLAAIALAGAFSEKIGGSLYDHFGPSHGYSITHGWVYGQWCGFAFTVIAFVFIPFLPAWTRSKATLGETANAKEVEGNEPSS
jgi:hypothetical protein